MQWIDQKYISLLASRLVRYKFVGNGVHRMRCPICGDSQKKETKTRGYFYEKKDRVRFKCHNCNAGMPLNIFIKELFPDLYKDYLFDFFAENPELSNRTKKEEDKALNIPKVNPEMFRNREKPSKRKEAVKTVIDGFPTIAELDDDHYARAYLDSRMIPKKFYYQLRFCPDPNKLSSKLINYEGRKIPDDPAILIPHRTAEQDGFDLVYVQCRFIENEKLSPYMRYMTLEVQEGEKLWGLDGIDFEKPIYALEGAFDAMFVPNAIATSDANLVTCHKYLRERTNQDIRYIWDYDYRTNYQIYKQLNAAIKNGHTVVLLDENLGGKDVNKAIQNGRDVKSIQNYLESRTFSGLAAMLELGRIKPPAKPTFNKNGTKTKSKAVPQF